MLHPSSGIGQFAANSVKAIRFLRKGCANRPFYHIVVAEARKSKYEPVIEQLGTYDPIPNEYEEKLVSLNYERIQYWIGNGAKTSKPVAHLLGLAGFFPVHPNQYLRALRNRRKAKAEELHQDQTQVDAQ
ncbi:hypothetical protein FQA39_LY04955 [Lamprigera yunnana]|nr:hypothetical protein FQA39_LY04955 [Lamprigera yunnana]